MRSVLSAAVPRTMAPARIECLPSLAAWTGGELADSDEERRIWRFVQAQPAHSRLLHLGFGRDDRFAAAHRLMADALPPDATDVVPGGHDWRTWKTLWENFLDSRFT